MSEQTDPSALEIITVVSERDNFWSAEHERLIKKKAKARIAFDLSIASCFMGGLYALPAILIAIFAYQRGGRTLPIVSIINALLSLAIWLFVFNQLYQNPNTLQRFNPYNQPAAPAPTPQVTPTAQPTPPPEPPFFRVNSLTTDDLIYDDPNAADIGLTISHHLYLQHDHAPIPPKNPVRYLFKWYLQLQQYRPHDPPMVECPELQPIHLYLMLMQQSRNAVFLWHRFKPDQDPTTIIAWRTFPFTNQVTILYGDGNTRTLNLEMTFDLLPYDAIPQPPDIPIIPAPHKRPNPRI